MKLIKSLGYYATSMLLHTSVLLVICAFCFNVLIKNSQDVKNVLIDADVYSTFVDSVIADNETNQSQASLPLDNVEINQIVNEAFQPDDLKVASESFIDGLYGWLDGSSENLEFTIDFTSQREQMLQNISNYAAQRISNLPTCGDDPQPSQDIFTIECRPLGYFPKDAREQVYGDLSSGEFLKDPVISHEDLPLASDGTSLQEKYKFIPTIYKILSISVPISLAVFVFALAAYLSIRRPMNKAFKALGRDLLTSGLSLIAFTLVIGFLLPKFFDSFKIQGGSTTVLLNKVSDTFVRQLDVVVINVALQVAALGLAILVLRSIAMSGSGRYSKVESKSGITTGIAKRKTKSKARPTKKPPIQTSESTAKRKISKQKSKRYRKIKP